MEEKRKGIKRHESLKPLSHHHTYALHIALKLSRMGTDKSLLTLEEMKEELHDFWEPGGQQHFREEEEILLTSFAQYASIDRPEITDMLLEHVTIRSLIDIILCSTAIDIKTMHKLSTILEKHIRKEERIIFPMIEETLPEDVLIKLAPYLH